MANSISFQQLISNQKFENYFPADPETIESLKRMALARFKFNPQVFIAGKKGCGSSHLLQATKNYLEKKHGDDQVILIAPIFLQQLEELEFESKPIQKLVKEMLQCDFLLLDNIHEWISNTKIFGLMKTILTNRLEKRMPVLFSIHSDAEAALNFPSDFPISSDGISMESDVPNRQKLFKILRNKLGEHEEQQDRLPDYALFYAIEKNFGNVDELIQFVFEIRDVAKEKTNFKKHSAGMIENVINNHYKKWKI